MSVGSEEEQTVIDVDEHSLTLSLPKLDKPEGSDVMHCTR